MLEINKRYIRTAPNGEKTLAIIVNEQELQYHNDLASQGFIYAEVEAVKPTGSVCISCEG